VKLSWAPASSAPGSARRVAVTGLGVVSCAGIGTEAFWTGLLAPPPEGIRRVEGFDPAKWFNPKEVRRLDRFSQFNIAAAAMALDDAGGVDSIGVDPARAGVIMGAGVGGLETLQGQIIAMHEGGPRKVSPFLVPMMMANAGCANISMRYGFTGPSETIVTACAAGTHAIGNAGRLVAMGRCDVVLAGASEAPLVDVGVTAFANMTALSTSGTSRPFDVERDGFMVAEGAAVLVLEDYERAVARGAHIYAELAGAASTADAFHITAPSPDGAGAARCMELAIEDAGLTPSDIAHVNAHGTSTPLNDRAEADALVKVFGTPGPPVTSIKGVTGHALGAAGAIEAVSVALTIEKRAIPPTAGLVNQDPEIPLDIVKGQPRIWEPGPVISNSFGFGGHNGCLVFLPPNH
jgi:3-oxoacyl-[acyl-carrier-protein] synthase II